jgi:peptidoglycan-N-acetylglucosamine deacetylase
MSAFRSAGAVFAIVLSVLGAGGALAQDSSSGATSKAIAGPPPPATLGPPPPAAAGPPPPPASGPVPAAAGYTPPPECAARSDLLGISRIVEIDTASGPRFGEQHKGQDFLNDGEVVLTFDDGPMRRYTERILQALDEQCTKATFFSVGRMAISDPAMLQEVARRGHTIGVHTWSHKKIPSLSAAAAKTEIELGLSAVSKALGAPVAPFFRFPYLAENKSALAYLQGRELGVFGIHVDSRDFRTRSPGVVLRNVLAQLDRTKKGIILFHDIQPSTAGALASLLAELKTRGYKVVHMIPKTPATTLPEYDAMAQKSLEAKVAARAANPMATRAATWPNQGAGESTSGETAPAPRKSGAGSTRPSKTSGQAVKKLDWANPDNEPWQLKTLSD